MGRKESNQTNKQTQTIGTKWSNHYITDKPTTTAAAHTHMHDTHVIQVSLRQQKPQTGTLINRDDVECHNKTKLRGRKAILNL